MLKNTYEMDVIQVRMSNYHIDLIDKLSYKRRTTRSQVVRNILISYLEKKFNLLDDKSEFFEELKKEEKK